jgi:hypothetical protein
MLDRDEATEVPGVSRHVRASPQYFDGEKLVGDATARASGLSQTVWDAFLFYEPGAAWPAGAQMPAPELVIAQVGGIVAGTPGTLPALEDQSRLLPDLVGKLSVIGAQRDIEAILRRVAQPVAERHRTRR